MYIKVWISLFLTMLVVSASVLLMASGIEIISKKERKRNSNTKMIFYVLGILIHQGNFKWIIAY